LAFFLLCVPFYGLAEGSSPSIDRLYWSDPYMPFERLDNKTGWDFLFSQVNSKYNLQDLAGGHAYSLEEALLIRIEQRFTRVIWHFPTNLTEAKNVRFIFIPQDLRFAKTLTGRVTDDGGILLNFASLTVNNYYMFVYVRWE